MLKLLCLLEIGGINSQLHKVFALVSYPECDEISFFCFVYINCVFAFPLFKKLKVECVSNGGFFNGFGNFLRQLVNGERALGRDVNEAVSR